MTGKVKNLNYWSLMICSKVLGKRRFLGINRSTFYLKEKCDNSLICEVFLFVVVNGEGRGGEKNQLVGGDVVKLWKKK